MLGIEATNGESLAGVFVYACTHICFQTDAFQTNSDITWIAAINKKRHIEY